MTRAMTTPAVGTAGIAALALLSVPASAAPPLPSTATVTVRDNAFVAPSVTLQLDKAGKATVTWQWETTSTRPHNVRDDAKRFDSHPACGGGAGVVQCGLTGATTFRQTFTRPGTYTYHCAIHGAPRSGMAGTVVVKAAPRGKR